VRYGHPYRQAIAAHARRRIFDFHRLVGWRRFFLIFRFLVLFPFFCRLVLHVARFGRIALKEMRADWCNGQSLNQRAASRIAQCVRRGGSHHVSLPPLPALPWIRNRGKGKGAECEKADRPRRLVIEVLIRLSPHARPDTGLRRPAIPTSIYRRPGSS